MNKKVMIIIAVILVLVGLLVLFSKNKNKVRYQTELLEKHTIIQVVEASGTINPVNTVSIGSTVSGLMKEIYVDFNSEVKKGQLLAQMDTSLFDTQAAQNLAAISNARANLVKIQAIAENDRKTYNRYKNLVGKNFMAKSELDLAESTYKSDLAQISAAKAQIAQAQASYNTIATNLRFTRIISPVDGTVVARNIDVGQAVAASFQAPELFTVAQDLKQMQIEVSVSEADIGKVKVGQDVNYTLDGYQDQVFKGKVTQVRISPTTVQNVVTYSVIVKVNNEDLKLKPGMTANVSIITSKKDDVLAVENIALKFTPNTKGDAPKYKNQGIWIMQKKKPTRVDIKVGVSNDTHTEVISTQLQSGDTVITGILDKNSKTSKGAQRPPRMF